MYHRMHILHAIKSNCQTRLLNVFGQTEKFWGDKNNTKWSRL